MTSNPTFVLVPGNFLPPTYYATIASLLNSHSYETRLVTLPSTGSDAPLTSNEPDVAAVRKILEVLCDLGKNVIIVAHSYGSIPSCEAVKGLESYTGQSAGKLGGVLRIVMVAAWLLQEGESAPNMIERYKVEAKWARFEGGNLYADDPTYAFHNDTSADVAAQWLPYTTHSDLAAFATPLKYAAWHHIPTTYVLCDLDRCIPLNAQEGMAASTDGKVESVRLHSGHMPMLSVPEKLTDVLIRVAGFPASEEAPVL